MKRYLFVNPWISDFAAFDFWLKPLGLLRLAACLREAGAQIHLLDLVDRNHPWLPKRTKTDAWGRGKFFAEETAKPATLTGVSRKFKRYGLPRQTVEKKLSELPDADAVLLTSGMTYWYTGVRETIEVLRLRYPDIPVILGGVYASLLAPHARAHSGADVVLEGSYGAFREKLESLLGLRLPENTGFPAWDLYEKLDYTVTTVSQGCPLSCTYCASKRLEPWFAPGRAEDVLAEFEAMRNLGVRKIAFYDDALLFYPRFEELLEMIIGMDGEFELHTPNGLHVTKITEDRAGLMRQAGFRSLYLSLESVDEELLATTGAKLSPQAFRNAARILKNAGFEKDALHAYILFGLPGQSEASVRKTVDTAIAEDVIPHLAEFSPVPGTPDYYLSGLDDDSDPLLTNNTRWCTRPDLVDSLERLKAHIKISGRNPE